MTAAIPPGGRVSGRRLATMLGLWRRTGSRHGAADLAAAIEREVLDGVLAAGTRLPAEREFAEALGVSRTLLGATLDRLRENGFVQSRRGAGSWVSVPGTRREPPLPDGGDLIDLARASSAATSGLLPAFDAARRPLMAELTGHGYSERGLPVLRERLAARYTARGLPTTPAQLMITNGAHHAFALALRALTGPGDRVLVEQPSYPNALDTVRGANTIPVPVAVDPGGERGWDLTGIEAALRQASPRLAYTIVDFQNPTGRRMNAEDRARFGAILARARTPVVVDETVVELDFTGRPPPPMAVFAEDLAVTVGSAAKSHWGGLRLGWIRASEDLLARLAPARNTLDLGSPILDQLILAELLADPESLLRKRRQDLRGLRDVLVDELSEHCPEWTFRVPDGGQSLWCRLPEPMSTRLAVAAANHGVQLAPGSRFGAHGGLERWVRVPFTLPADRLADAVRRLGTAAASVRGMSGTVSGIDVPVT
jgi:DNA-binding transcriptional MocR family regulator